MYGTLYGIGVGPGDPELLTLKAVRIIREVHMIFAASSTKNDYSLALDTIRGYVPEDTPIRRLDFPMTFDRDHLRNAWRSNCLEIIDPLEQGKDVAFVTLGDPMTFSTFIYLYRTVKSIRSEIPVITIPGITSYQAAAARACVPLAEGEETITIMSAAKGGERLNEILPFSDNVVLMKTYKRFDSILEHVRKLGLDDRCCFVSRCGLEDERIEIDIKSLEDMKPPYLSLMILKKQGFQR